MPKRRKKKGTDAWKSLVRTHKKGPKRIKIAVPRSKDGINPLTISEHSKHVQIVVSDGLQKPRKIMLMVNAGKTIDKVINSLEPYLSEGDILIDGGNSHYKDTQIREEY